MKLRDVFLVIFTLLILAVAPVAAAPYQSYTYDFWNFLVPAPHAYVPETVVYGQDVGTTPFKTPQDVFVSADNEIYMVDTGNNRILHFDEEWNLIREIAEFDNDGTVEKFRTPRGVHVNAAGDIYIADRENGRIVILDRDLQVKMIIASPTETQPEFFTSDFRFRPDKLSVDDFGTIYAISMGVYDGIMEFDVTGGFQGFIGAPRVNPSLVDYIWRVIGTDAQKQRMKLFLPVEHSNLHVDDRGFVYATAIGGSIGVEEKVRRLNTQGIDRLVRIPEAPPVGDFPDTISVFVDVISRNNDVYTVLDRTNGRIFTYNRNGELLYSFSALGDVEGTFRNPVGMAELDGRLLVVDAIKNSVTVFRPTAYQSLIHQAIDSYSEGDYDTSTQLWYEVLKYNANYDMAYTGIGNALLMQHDYEGAMENFKLANNRPTYSEAYEAYRQEQVEKYFGWILLAVVVITVYILFFATSRSSEQSVAESKAEVAATYAEVMEWEEMPKRSFKLNMKRLGRALKFSTKLIFSPVQGFWDLKTEKRGNVPAATVILIMVIVTYLFSLQFSGFIFNTRNPLTVNLLSETISILVPFFLWVVISWSLTTLMNGKGNLKDIYIATAYSLTPIILILIPLTIASNFLTIEEGAFYYLFLTVSLVWSLGLAFFGTMSIHDYSLGGTVATCIFTLIGIGIALFVALVFADIVLQLFSFFGEVYTEFAFRL